MVLHEMPGFNKPHRATLRTQTRVRMFRWEYRLSNQENWGVVCVCVCVCGWGNSKKNFWGPKSNQKKVSSFFGKYSRWNQKHLSVTCIPHLQKLFEGNLLLVLRRVALWGLFKDQNIDWKALKKNQEIGNFIKNFGEENFQTFFKTNILKISEKIVKEELKNVNLSIFIILVEKIWNETIWNVLKSDWTK